MYRAIVKLTPAGAKLNGYDKDEWDEQAEFDGAESDTLEGLTSALKSYSNPKDYIIEVTKEVPIKIKFTRKSVTIDTIVEIE